MNDDDAAYTALLTQLLSDTSSSRNQRVHSWIEHQYDFALSEESIPSKVANDDDKSYLSFSCPSRTPSPSPSSSLGAHRTFSIDRPDSPLLPRMSAECGRLDGAGTRPRTDSSARAPSYDALFFPAPSSPELLIEDEEREERERERALRFLVQEMANWRMQNSPITPHKGSDKPLPSPPPPSPASSATQSSPSRKPSQSLRSRSSSLQISRLPSFTSTLSSDQSSTQDVFAQPVSVIVHGDSQHELHAQYGLLSAKRDSCILGASPIPSPTLSSFSSSWNPGTELETEATTPYASFPASPASATFAAGVCLPASPESGQLVFPEVPSVSEGVDALDAEMETYPVSPCLTAFPVSPTTTVFPTSPTTTIFPASPSSSYFPSTEDTHIDHSQLRPPAQPETHTETHSRWSVATTASLTPSTVEPKSPSFLHRPKTPSKSKPAKSSTEAASTLLKTPTRRRTRFISLISRLSPRSEHAPPTPADAPEYDSADEVEDEVEEAIKPVRAPSKKPSLASLRASLSLSRASFASHRPVDEEVPPLPTPTSPPRSSFSVSRASLAGGTPEAEVIPPVPSRRPSRLSLRGGDVDVTAEEVPPMPMSASTVTSFSVVPPPPQSSRVSLLPSPSETSLLSEFPAPPTTPGRTKSIFGRPKTPSSKARQQTKLPLPSSPSMDKLSSMGMSTDKLPGAASQQNTRIPPAPRSFIPPTKLRQPLPSPSSKLPPPPMSTVTPPTPSPTKAAPSSKFPPASRVTGTKLPLPAQTQSHTPSKMATVRGFWRRGAV